MEYIYMANIFEDNSQLGPLVIGLAVCVIIGLIIATVIIKIMDKRKEKINNEIDTAWKVYEGEKVDTPEPPDPGTMRTIWFDNSSNNFAEPYCHVWKSEGGNDVASAHRGFGIYGEHAGSHDDAAGAGESSGDRDRVVCPDKRIVIRAGGGLHLQSGAAFELQRSYGWIAGVSGNGVHAVRLGNLRAAGGIRHHEHVDLFDAAARWLLSVERDQDILGARNGLSRDAHPRERRESSWTVARCTWNGTKKTVVSI